MGMEQQPSVVSDAALNGDASRQQVGDPSSEADTNVSPKLVPKKSVKGNSRSPKEPVLVQKKSSPAKTGGKTLPQQVPSSKVVRKSPRNVKTSPSLQEQKSGNDENVREELEKDPKGANAESLQQQIPPQEPNTGDDQDTSAAADSLQQMPPQETNADANNLQQMPPQEANAGDGTNLQQMPAQEANAGDGDKLQQMPPQEANAGDGDNLQQMPPQEANAGDGDNSQQMPPLEANPGDGDQQMPPQEANAVKEEDADNSSPLQQMPKKENKLPPLRTPRNGRIVRKGSLQNGRRSNLAPPAAPAAAADATTTQPEPPKGAPSSPGRGLYLLKLAKTSHISGDNPSKTLDYASRAVKILEACSSEGGKPSLEMVMSLHIVAAAYCRMGRYSDAVDALERTLNNLPKEFMGEGGLEYSLAAFAGYMQLGDTYAKLGKQDKALASYRDALGVQKQALGEMEPQVGETCRYVAEAHLQAMQFKEAEELCEHVLKIHAERSPPGSVEEAIDRRLMALIQSGKGEHEMALEHLVFASTAMSSQGQDAHVASIDASIGDCYVALGRYDEAIFSYQKALSAFKQSKGEGHASVASMYVSLGELSLKTGKHRDAKAYCENALRIYGKQGAGHAFEDLAAGLTDIAGIFEALSEHEQALCLLQRALDSIDRVPGEQCAAAGIQAQMGVLYYIMGRFSESYATFSSAVAKLKAGAERKTVMLGVLLNQMGLALFELNQIDAAVEVLEEAQAVLVEACGVHHPDTLAVCSNLAAGYDALGRVDNAIHLLDKVLQSQEERLGTVHPDVVDERLRLEQMLREVGRTFERKASTLEELLLLPPAQSKRFHRLVT